MQCSGAKEHNPACGYGATCLFPDIASNLFASSHPNDEVPDLEEYLPLIQHEASSTAIGIQNTDFFGIQTGVFPNELALPSTRSPTNIAIQMCILFITSATCWKFKSLRSSETSK
jgi:hypothetical protein